MKDEKNTAETSAGIIAEFDAKTRGHLLPAHCSLRSLTSGEK